MSQVALASSETTFPIVHGEVTASVSDGAGGVFIAGTFRRVGDVRRDNLAHIAADGSVDPAWNPEGLIEGSVRTLALDDTGTLYVGGAFTSVGGDSARGCLAAVGSDGRWSDWAPGLTTDERIDPGNEAFAVRKGDPDALNYFSNWILIKESSGWLQERHDYWFGGRPWADQVAE